MKRVPEFVCGLIGSILALLVSLFFFVVAASLPSYYDGVNVTFAANGLGILVSIAAIVFAVLVNKKTKVSGIILIVASVVLLISNTLQIVSFALLLTAGIMALVRKVP